MSFADLIRAGNAQGLLRSDWPAWRRFREMRSRTSHAYDARLAAEVTSAIPAFLEEAEHLCAEIAPADCMNQTSHVDLNPVHASLVLGILRARLPEGVKVWVFGSRATGRARRYSDLDPGDRRRPATDAR